MYYQTPFLVSSQDEVVTIWEEKGLNWCSFHRPTSLCSSPLISPQIALELLLSAQQRSFSNGTRFWSKEFQDGEDFSLHQAAVGHAEFDQHLSPSQELCQIRLGTGASTFGHRADTWSQQNFCWLAFASVYPQQCYEAATGLCRQGIFRVMGTCKTKHEP